MADVVEYKAVLADLEAKRANLDHAIAAIKALISDGTASIPVPSLNGAGGAPQQQGPPSPPGIELDTFYGLNIVGATKKYLGMVRKAQSTETIAEALRSGGVVAKTESVAAVLQRAAKAGDPDLRRPRPGMWGLSAWYGG